MNIEERCPLDIPLDLQHHTPKVQQTSSYFIDIQPLALAQSANYQDLCTIEINK